MLAFFDLNTIVYAAQSMYLCLKILCSALALCVCVRAPLAREPGQEGKGEDAAIVKLVLHSVLRELMFLEPNIRLKLCPC